MHSTRTAVPATGTVLGPFQSALPILPPNRVGSLLSARSRRRGHPPSEPFFEVSAAQPTFPTAYFPNTNLPLQASTCLPWAEPVLLREPFGLTEIHLLEYTALPISLLIRLIYLSSPWSRPGFVFSVGDVVGPRAVYLGAGKEK